MDQSGGVAAYDYRAVAQPHIQGDARRRPVPSRKAWEGGSCRDLDLGEQGLIRSHRNRFALFRQVFKDQDDGLADVLKRFITRIALAMATRQGGAVDEVTPVGLGNQNHGKCMRHDFILSRESMNGKPFQKTVRRR